VTILDDDIAEDGAAFLVMELLEGASAESLWDVAGRRLPASAVLVIAHELLELLAVAHEKSIIHRDVKPANLFVSKDGAVKVLDFGIARVRDATAEASSTNTGTLLGTPAFMPPEQAGGQSSDVDGRTDVWSVGATLFTLLSGEYVHRGGTPTQMAIQAATQPARSLAAVLPDAPASIVALVDRALSFAKENRWESAQAMADAVAAAHESLFGAAVSRGALVALVAEHAKLSGHLKATAATMKAERSDAELAPTLPQQATPAFTPVSPLAQSAQLSASTGGQVSESQRGAATGASAATRRGTPTFGIAVIVVALAAAAIFVFRSGSPADVPRETSVAATTTGPAPPPVASSAGTPTARILLAIAPADAVVELDGKPVPVMDGVVSMVGSPGSMHLVHITSGGRDATYPVLVTENGAVPPRVELAPAPSSTGVGARRPIGAKPAPPGPTAAQPSGPPPTATSSQGAVSRTME
jgi:serine/threonine-protein kinase